MAPIETPSTRPRLPPTFYAVPAVRRAFIRKMRLSVDHGSVREESEIAKNEGVTLQNVSFDARKFSLSVTFEYRSTWPFFPASLPLFRSRFSLFVLSPFAAITPFACFALGPRPYLSEKNQCSRRATSSLVRISAAMPPMSPHSIRIFYIYHSLYFS